MGEVVIMSIDQGLKDLFRWVYSENCQIEDSTFTDTDRETIDDLDSFEVLENLKDLVKDLMEAKRELRKTDKGELMERCEQFEAMLQKLENDVRTHIRVPPTQIEQQLKIQIDTAQARIDELESSPATLQLDQLKDALKSKEKEVQDLKSRFSPTIELLSKEYSRNKDHKRILSLEPIIGESSRVEKAGSDGNLHKSEKRYKSVLRLEQEIGMLKATLQARNAEIEKLKNSVSRDPLPRVPEPKKPDEPDKLRPPSNSKLRFDRALSERQDPKKLPAETENPAVRRPALSPYKGVDHSRTHSRSRLNPSPIPYLRGDRHHARTISDRVKRQANSVRGYYKG